LSDLGIATPVVRIGWPDRFIEHGKVDALRAKYGLTVDAAMEKLRPVLAATQKSPVAVRSAQAR
jgi:1-deoxy-D-xylulose-5-phosphate synthase